MSPFTPISLLLSAVFVIVSYGYVRTSKTVAGMLLVGGLALTWATWGMATGAWEPLKSDPDPQIALKSSQWKCAESHKSTSTALIPAGKALMPVTTTSTICDRYERR